MNDQRPSPIVRNQMLIEASVRSALAESLVARRMRLGEIDSRSFGNRALELLHASLDDAKPNLDALGLYALESATVAAAARFFSSKLGRRLLTMDVARIRRAPLADIDASVHDEHGNTHAVRIEACTNDDERIELGRAIASHAESTEATIASRIHLFSLRDGRLRSFTYASNAKRHVA